MHQQSGLTLLADSSRNIIFVKSGSIQAVTFGNGQHSVTSNAVHNHFFHPVISSPGLMHLYMILTIQNVSTIRNSI